MNKLDEAIKRARDAAHRCAANTDHKFLDAIEALRDEHRATAATVRELVEAQRLRTNAEPVPRDWRIVCAACGSSYVEGPRCPTCKVSYNMGGIGGVDAEPDSESR